MERTYKTESFNGEHELVCVADGYALSFADEFSAKRFLCVLQNMDNTVTFEVVSDEIVPQPPYYIAVKESLTTAIGR